MLLENENALVGSTVLKDFNKIGINDIIRFVIISFKDGGKAILFTFIIGLILGFSYYFFKKPEYSSQMTGYSEQLPKEIVEYNIADLQELINQKDYDQLSGFLGLSVGKVRQIVSLKAKPAIEKSIYDTEESNVFVLDAVVTDLNVFDSLSNAIGYYFENNHFVKLRIDQEKKNLIYSIEKMNVEIVDLTELKIEMKKAIEKNTYRTNLFLSDIGYSSSKIVELYEKQSSLRNKLELIDDVKIMRDFVKFKQKRSPKLILSIITFEALAFMFLFLFWGLQCLRTYWRSL